MLQAAFGLAVSTQFFSSSSVTEQLALQRIRRAQQAHQQQRERAQDEIDQLPSQVKRIAQASALRSTSLHGIFQIITTNADPSKIKTSTSRSSVSQVELGQQQKAQPSQEEVHQHRGQAQGNAHARLFQQIGSSGPPLRGILAQTDQVWQAGMHQGGPDRR